MTRQLRSEEGAVLVAGLLLTVVMMLAIGFAVDLGHAFIARRDLAAVADQAALTGSQAIGVPALHDGRLMLDPALARADAMRVVGAERGVRGSAHAPRLIVASRADGAQTGEPMSTDDAACDEPALVPATAPLARSLCLGRHEFGALAVGCLLLDIAPVLLGSGERIFDGVESFGMEPVEVLHSPLATHIRYRRAD